MNTCLKYILGFLLGSWLFTGCHYADMLEFNDIPRVSFVGVDKNGSDTYDPTTLAASLNFGENLKGDSISCDTMTVRIVIGSTGPATFESFFETWDSCRRLAGSRS